MSSLVLFQHLRDPVRKEVQSPFLGSPSIRPLQRLSVLSDLGRVIYSGTYHVCSPKFHFIPWKESHPLHTLDTRTLWVVESLSYPPRYSIWVYSSWQTDTLSVSSTFDYR